MPRKKKPVEAVMPAPAEEVNATAVMPETTVAEPVSPPVEERPSTSVTVAEVPLGETPLGETPLGEGRLALPKDPHASEPATTVAGQPTIVHRPLWIQTKNLGRDDKGPRMRLGRSERFQQMVIQFDEKPTDDTRIQLGDAGWRWRPFESQWTRQLDFENRASDQIQAEKLFEEIAWHERRERGLPGTQPSPGR